MSLLVAAIVVTIGTIIYAMKARGRKAPMSVVAVIIGSLIVGGMVAITGWSKLQDQRLRDQCTFSVSRSDGNRQQWLDLAQFLQEHDVSSTAVSFIVDHLDVNLPQRTFDDCPKA
jgi:hypothetical protein